MQDYSKQQKDSQCLGKSSFDYALYPHKGNWQAGQVFKQVSSHNQRLNILQVAKNHGSWPKKRSFLKLQPDDLVITAVKKAEKDHASVIRFFNPTEKTITGSVHLDFDISSAHYVTLEEEPLSECKVSNNTVSFEAASKKIVSVKIFANPE